jgi:hypothetical protein
MSYSPTNSIQLLRGVAAAAATVALCAGALMACSSASSLPCSKLRPGQARRAVMLLSDGRSPALASAVDAFANDPSTAFSAASLGFHAAEGKDVAGTVVLATYDDSGTIKPHGTFNLEGVGSNAKRRTANAQRQAQCLEHAAAVLPKAGGGDLLRALASATQSIHASSGGDAAVVAIGLGRSTIEGKAVAKVDLSKAGQAKVFQALAGVSLIPDLSSGGAALRFLAPSEDVASGISAAGVSSFADALCARLGAAVCTSGTTLS